MDWIIALFFVEDGGVSLWPYFCTYLRRPPRFLMQKYHPKAQLMCVVFLSLSEEEEVVGG